jgi:iodotyrosine deiodinase
MASHGHIPLDFPVVATSETVARAQAFFEEMNHRRSVRHFSERPVPREVIEAIIRTGSSAPSGAHRQPWTFVAISDPDLKRRMREAAEAEEYESYHGRMPEEWLEALAPLGTDWRKPFIETVPWIVVLFAQRYGVAADGGRVKNYYVQESCGLAAGLFVAAVHTAGLATLTHTPSPMGFLSELLKRPENEVPYILFPVGYPADGATVPDIERKPLEEIAVFFEGSRRRRE